MLCASTSAVRVSEEMAAGCGRKVVVPAGRGTFLLPEHVHRTPTPISVTSRTWKPLSPRTWGAPRGVALRRSPDQNMKNEKLEVIRLVP